VFDLINGLPVHPLVVHAVVVLVPLAALGTIAIALRPAWRRTYGPLVAAFAILGAVLCPVATSSGQALAQRVGNPGQHAALGGQLVWFVIPLAVLALALVLLERRGRTGAGVASTVLTGVAALAVLASLATVGQVYRVGDSGANAVWGGLVPSSAGGGDASD
jgi:hypothetical protein